jgi:hypothetical protein
MCYRHMHSSIVDLQRVATYGIAFLFLAPAPSVTVRQLQLFKPCPRSLLSIDGAALARVACCPSTGTCGRKKGSVP